MAKAQIEKKIVEIAEKKTQFEINNNSLTNNDDKNDSNNNKNNNKNNINQQQQGSVRWTIKNEVLKNYSNDEVFFSKNYIPKYFSIDNYIFQELLIIIN
jgi:hypothetical protein